MNKPLLIFPLPTTLDRSTRPSGIGKIHFPTKDQQIERLEEKITELERVLQNEAAAIQRSPHGLVPEMILVMEIAGDLNNFYRAVAKTPGMEFLSEYYDERDVDEFFYGLNTDGTRREKPFTARLFLTMTNEQALRELLRYWTEYKKNRTEQNFPDGTKKFRLLFEQLIDLRTYSIEDRLRDTGMAEYLSELEAFGIQSIHFEVELAFKNTTVGNDRVFQYMSDLLSANNGRVIEESRTIIDAIEYHAFIAEAPISCFDVLTEATDVDFLKCQHVLFFRPVGQAVFTGAIDDETARNLPTTNQTASEQNNRLPAYVALLDGFPLANHQLLGNNIIVDDPDNFSASYTASKRIHGTAMASIILNGDLSDSQRTTLKHPLYVQPILKPDANGITEGEFLPDNRLAVDLVHRAVVRMFEGEPTASIPAVAPKVKIINFSIGDPYRPFNANICALAKLIDWLSYKYNVLFVISAGNYSGDLLLDIPSSQFGTASRGLIENQVISTMVDEAFDRKILAPSESVNSLTVGASHSDSAIWSPNAGRHDLLSQGKLISPISRIGFGFKKSVKPEILTPGGKKIFRQAPIQRDPTKTHLTAETFPISSSPPGISVATPGLLGSVNSTGFISGTSASAAMTSHYSGLLHEMLDDLNNTQEERIPEEYSTVLLKALTVHGARWGQEQLVFENILRNRPGIAANTLKKNILPFLGYGTVDLSRTLNSSDYRVTLIGFGKLTKEKAHLFRFPLPNAISQKKIFKRLTLTLAWLTPLNFRTYKYRQAHLYYNNLDSVSGGQPHLYLQRNYYDFDTAQKGTIQHDVLEGDKADAYVVGDHIEIKVNCREDASYLSMRELIKYGLMVTLEVKEADQIPIYDEIKAAITTRVRPRV
jgi:hypothetical protein